MWSLPPLLLLLILIQIVLTTAPTPASFPAPTHIPITAELELIEMKAQWKLNLIRALETSALSSRDAMLAKTLKIISGIYSDKTKANALPRLQNTIMLNVVEAWTDTVAPPSSSSSTSSSKNYNSMLKNFLCFNKQYGFQSLVYILDSQNVEYQTNSSRFASSASEISVGNSE
jgi:hypothetical protein